MIFGISYAVLWVMTLFHLLVILVIAQRLEHLRVQPAVSTGMPSQPPLRRGAAAPDFSASKLGSSGLVQTSDFHGNRTLLLFLSTDCSDCRVLIAELEQLRQGALRGLVIYCVGGREQCDRFLGAIAATVPVLCQGSIDVTAAYRVSGVPTAVALDPSWRVDEVLQSVASEEIAKHLELLLTERERNPDSLHVPSNRATVQPHSFVQPSALSHE